MKNPTKKNSSAFQNRPSFQVRQEQYEKPVIPPRGPVLPELEDDSTGLPFDSDIPSRRRPAVRLAETLDKILKAHRLGSVHNPPPDAMLIAWPDLAGPELTSRLTIEKFEKGILYVGAKSNSDLYEIRMYHLRPLEVKLKKHPAFSALRQIRIILSA